MDPHDAKDRRARIARRSFLGALAAVPAALACATPGSSSRTTARGGARADVDSLEAREKRAIDAVRTFEPERDRGLAIVFRASPARPGGTR